MPSNDDSPANELSFDEMVSLICADMPQIDGEDANARRRRALILIAEAERETARLLGGKSH